jgi:branched-chain amino acid transport system substrate-binding protein
MTDNNRWTDTTGGRTGRRQFLRATGGVVALGGLAGCIGGDSGGDDGPITIGSLQPQSGNFSPWGDAHSAGMEFAKNEINDDGGVLDRDLEITESDTGSDPGEADTLFRKMVEEDGAVALTGPVSSDVGITTRDTAEELEHPLVLHMAGSHRILPKDTRYTFRMGSHSAVTDMRSVLGMIEEQGFTEVGAVIGDYEWGQSVRITLQELVPDAVNLSMEVTPVSTSDFAPVLRSLPQGTEVILASGHPPGSPTIHSQAIELGMDHEFTVGAGFPPGVLNNALGENSATFAHQHVSNPYSDDFVDVAQRFAEETGNRFDTHQAYGYSTMHVFAQAIEAADSTDPGDIADAMHGNEFDVLLENPINYTEYGEVNNLIHMLSTIESGAPEYYDEGSWQLNELYRSDPLPAFDPDEWPSLF